MIAMTLSKHRPQRTYGDQFLIDEIDTRGLLKVMELRVDEYGRDGLADTPYYVGAYIALSTLFSPEAGAEIDNWQDFMREFDKRLHELAND